MIDFLDQVLYIISRATSAINETTVAIDSVDFDSSIATDYYGYFHWVVGTTNYTLFTTLLLVSAGLTLWTTVLNGIAFIKNVVQWW